MSGASVMMSPDADRLSGSGGVEAAVPSPTRPLYWSVRRELWENRSIYLAPLAGAAVVLFSFLVSATTLPHRLRADLALDPAQQRSLLIRPYDFAAVLTVVAFVVGVFYCLDALHGERRDRSILFWKSLPVSDRTAVLAKASIPLVVLPLLTFALIVVTQLFLLLSSTAVLAGRGPHVATLWSHVNFFERAAALFYGVIAIALWHAPVYGWLLLVSGWTRRSAFLWAVFPVLALGAFERIAFGTSTIGAFLQHRATGWLTLAFAASAPGSGSADPLAAITAGRFLSNPGLWIGLAIAAACLAAAVRLRRYRGPV